MSSHTNPRIPRLLSVFVSSTGDEEMRPFRESAIRALHNLAIDERRYEAWPSSPNTPLEECMAQVEQCQAMVLILGSRYGSHTETGLSFTYQEYRKATELSIPVFAYVLESESRDDAQTVFVTEVERERFRGGLIGTPDELAERIIASFLKEFHLAFYEKYSPPTEVPVDNPETLTEAPIALPKDLADVLKFLQTLYRGGQDATIRRFATECEIAYGDDEQIMGLVYMAEVNAAQGLVPDRTSKDRLERAVRFWAGKKAIGRKDHAAILFNKGNALGALDRHSEAIGCYEGALRDEPGFAECWKNLGSSYDETEDVDNALRCLNQALQLNPSLIQAQLSLGTTLIRRGVDVRRGVDHLEQIPLAGAAPTLRAVVNTWKAHAFFELGLCEGGIELAEDAIDALPEAPWGWAIAARLYSLIRRQDPSWIQRAGGFFQRYLKKFPEERSAWAELGHALWLRPGRGDDSDLARRAKNAFVRAAELGFDDDGLIYDRIGHAFQSLGDFEEAERFFRMGAETNPPIFSACLGDFLVSQDRSEEALPFFQKALAENPDDPLLLFKLAQCNAKLGNFESAAEGFDAVISIDGENGAAWFNLAGMYWNILEFEKARDVWRDACTRFPDHEARQRIPPAVSTFLNLDLHEHELDELGESNLGEGDPEGE